MKPILKYPGAKWRLSKWIISHMPDHESYLEPFFGSGAILFNKSSSRIETVNDMDGEVVNFFRVCRDAPEELARLVSLTPWSRGEYEKSFDGEPKDCVERAWRFAIHCWMTFGAGNTRQRGWRHTTARNHDGGPDNPKLWRRLPGVIQLVADRLMDVQIENRPALDVIKRFDGPKMLLYVDPPYVKDTRSAHCDQYNYEMTDDDHMELLLALKNHSGMVMLSGYDCDLYRNMLGGWAVEMKNTTAESGKRRTECLWLNAYASECLIKEGAAT